MYIQLYNKRLNQVLKVSTTFIIVHTAPYYPIKFFKIDLENGDSRFQMFHFFIREREYASDRTPIVS